MRYAQNSWKNRPWTIEYVVLSTGSFKFPRRMQHWTKKERPLFDADHAVFSRKELDLEGPVQGRLHSVECSIERSSRKWPQRTWCYADHRLDPANVSTYLQQKQRTVLYDLKLQTRKTTAPTWFLWLETPNPPGAATRPTHTSKYSRTKCLRAVGAVWPGSRDNNASIHSAHKLTRFFGALAVTVPSRLELHWERLVNVQGLYEQALRTPRGLGRVTVDLWEVHTSHRRY